MKALPVWIACWLACPLAALQDDARARLIHYLNGIAQTKLDARKTAIAGLRTRADAEGRKTEVRAKILQLIGGLPEDHGPVNVKQFGTLAGDGFRVEKIAYESLPGFWVTANVYVPASGGGAFPAVLLTPGHEATGKVSQYTWGGNLARMGILAMAYDPLGQGERLQYFDLVQLASQIGGATGEHGEANLPMLLIGDQLARYMVNDAMRGVDYLTMRKDVDAARIGAFGCSGGGTATAYFAALDDRVKVAATACYITSFQELLNAPTGNQDAEQSIPHFIEQGLDFGDWVELAAPKPYAIVSTTDDMFPFEGARQTYEEAKRIYGLYDARDRIQWITGPGGHGNLAPIGSSILGFLAKYLKGTAAEVTYTPLRPERSADLTCTPTGQVATSLASETVASLNRKRAQGNLPGDRPMATRVDIDGLRTRLRQEIRTLTGAGTGPEIEAPGFHATPEGDGVRPGVLLLGSWPASDFERLATEGNVVMAVDPRPSPPGTESVKSPYLGIFNLLSLRAFLVGKTLLGIRVDDTLRAADWLRARKDVDRSRITVYGNGPYGMVALHAAVLDDRIGRVVLQNTLADYRMVIEQPMHRNISEVLIPGVLRHYDTGDLLLAVYPREVTVIHPRDAQGTEITPDEFRKRIAFVMETDRVLGLPNRIRVL